MRKTERLLIYPWDKGLNTTAMPGAQDRKSLTIAKNIVLRNNGARSKRPGVSELKYIGKKDGPLRGVVDFHGVSGANRFQETVRVINGRIEALRNGEFVDLEAVGLSPDDAVSFERFVNVLIIGFENSPPLYYSPFTGLQALPIPPSHLVNPPRFFRVHDFRLFYAGRQNNPHVLTASGINTIFNYSLGAGGSSIRINDGDGDPVGINGISPPFRGDIYVFKYGSFYRLPRTAYGYGVDQVTDQIGCVCHNTIVATPNDIFWVSDRAIHSLSMTDKYGAAEEATITYPIYEDFFNDVNWTAAKYMWATYDAKTNTYLLCYASQGSPVNNKLLGFNILTKEFFQWEGEDFVSASKFLDENRRAQTMIALEDGRLGVLDDSISSSFGNAVNMEIKSPLIFPRAAPSNISNFTQLKLFAKPTKKRVSVVVGFEIDGGERRDVTVDTYGDGDGAVIGSTDKIGFSKIGKGKDRLAVITIPLDSVGGAIEISMRQEPTVDDPDQPCEIYGMELEFDYSEDTAQTTTM